MPDLIALGGAECVWRDLEQALEICPGADIGAVNEAGSDYRGRLTVWATLHPEKFERWQRLRKQAGLNTDYITACHKKRANVRVDIVESERWSGTSGLYLCQVAIMNLGYDRVICCGMPIDQVPHYFDAKPWDGVSRYRRGWQEAVGQPELKGKIRSMSGWTRELVGPPDSQWLAVPTK